MVAVPCLCGPHRRDGSGCAVLLANDKYEDLSRMYRLFSRVEKGLEPMATIVRQHIERMGNEIINQREARITEGGEKDSNQDPTFVKVLPIPPWPLTFTWL
jgi:cullin 1